ncbi:MAG TPA: DUF4019 domain-containing protein [Allosphingosinicella sp.]|nr:DUF4019 domain-containing protein [Allosphingosinicella sp.]
MTIPVSPETADGQRLLAMRAIEICGTRYPVPGRYRFVGNERVAPDGTRGSSTFEVRQELTCSDTPPSPPTEVPAPADWRASARDEADARAATMAYFAAVDAGDAARVLAMMPLARRAEENVASRAEAMRTFRAEAGTPGAHRIIALSWYVNPASAPRPGIYVAADFERVYSGLAAVCGYVVWYRDEAGRYSLMREETAVVPRTAGSTPAALAQARAMARCRAN